MRRFLSLAVSCAILSIVPACGGGAGGGGGGAPTETTFVHLTTGANRFDNGSGLSWTQLDDPAINGDPTAKLIVTPWRTGGTSADPSPLAVAYDEIAGRWLLYNDSSIPLPLGAAFTVTAASDAFTHFATVGDAINPATSEISHPSLDNDANAVFFITRNHTPVGGGPGMPLTETNCGVTYFPPSAPLPGRWAIQAEDGALVLAGYAWNVLVRTGRSPAVRHTALPANTGAGNGLDPSETQTILLESPLGMHILHVRPLIAPIPRLTPPGAVTFSPLMNVFHQDGSAVAIGEQYFVWRP